MSCAPATPQTAWWTSMAPQASSKADIFSVNSASQSEQFHCPAVPAPDHIPHSQTANNAELS